METIENTFYDNEGNHLLVALDFYDNLYKKTTLHIPEEYSDIDIVDISISKLFVNKPIHFSAFFKMCSWLLECFNRHPTAIFTYICSTEELNTNHENLEPHLYRWILFDVLLKRSFRRTMLNIQDVVVGPEGYQSYGRAIYRNKQAPIIHIVVAHLQEKQQDYH